MNSSETRASQLVYHSPELLVYGDIREYTQFNAAGIGLLDRPVGPMGTFKTGYTGPPLPHPVPPTSTPRPRP